jgi:hypothetical protein
MVLLERGTFLGSLDGWLAQAIDGHGCLVLVGGEAGIGKTSLVGAFRDRHGADARVLWEPATRCGPRARSARCSTSPARPAGW